MGNGSWDAWFQSCGYNLSELKRQRQVGLKFGQEVKQNFSMDQFLTQLISLNTDPKKPRPFDPDNMIYNTCCEKLIPLFGLQYPIIKQPFFKEGQPQVQKLRKGIFKKKDVFEPAKYFLLFEDEEFRELMPPSSDERVGNLWPFDVDYKNDIIFGAGKAYCTGRRIIFDAYYTEAGSDFGTAQIWGPIDLRSCAGAFNKPFFVLEYPKGLGKAHAPTTSLENEMIHGVIRDQIWILGIGQFGIPGTGQDVVKLASMFRTADGHLEPYSARAFPQSFGTLYNEIKSLRPTALEDIFAMWQYAADNGFSRVANHEYKKPVSLKLDYWV